MRALGVVERDVLGEARAGLLDGRVVFQINLLVFDRAPETLGEDVVLITGSAVHADAHASVAQHIREREAGERTALVAVEDGGCWSSPIFAGKVVEGSGFWVG